MQRSVSGSVGERVSTTNERSISEANAILMGGSVEEINENFAIDPRSENDYHRPVPKNLEQDG